MAVAHIIFNVFCCLVFISCVHLCTYSCHEYPPFAAWIAIFITKIRFDTCAISTVVNQESCFLFIIFFIRSTFSLNIPNIRIVILFIYPTMGFWRKVNLWMARYFLNGEHFFELFFIFIHSFIHKCWLTQNLSNE